MELQVGGHAANPLKVRQVASVANECIAAIPPPLSTATHRPRELDQNDVSAPALEDGHPGRLGRRASCLPETRQPPHHHPSSPQPDPIGRGCGGAYPICRQPQRMPTPAAGAPRQGERTGGMMQTSAAF